MREIWILALVVCSVFIVSIGASAQAGGGQSASQPTQQTNTQPAGAGATQQQPTTAQPSSTPKPKNQTEPAAKSCTGTQVPLAVLTGSDADALAHTLSSVFHEFVVTAVANNGNSASGGTEASGGSDSGQQSSSTKNGLCVKERSQAKAKGTTAAKAVSSSTSALQGVVACFDRDRFKGVSLNSDYLVQFANDNITAALTATFPHPLPDFDLEPCGCETGSDENSCYLMLVPSSAAFAQSLSSASFNQHAAQLNHDLKFFDTVRCLPGDLDSEQTRELLLKQAEGQVLSAPELNIVNATVQALTQRFQVKPEEWFAEHTLRLAALDPRDVKIRLSEKVKGELGLEGCDLQVESMDRSIALLPRGIPPNDGLLLAAQAIERNVVYEAQAREAKLWQATATKASSGGSGGASPPATTTTTTTKTTVAPASGKTPATTTSSTTVKTSDPPASASGQSSGGTQNSGSGSGGQSSSQSAQNQGGKSGAQAPASSQPKQSFQLDHIVRLFHLRDAAGIAEAINAVSASGSNSRPVVEALSDNGANDLLLILPPPPGEQDHSTDIRRGIALLDLPRPQLSLQVWSMQISSKVKDEQSSYKNSNEKDAARDTLEDLDRKVNAANTRMTSALQEGMRTIFDEARVLEGDLFFDDGFRKYLTGKYENCLLEDRYCLGYYDALDVPITSAGRGSVNASLGKLLLFIAAADDTNFASHQGASGAFGHECPAAAQDLICEVITAMQDNVPDPPVGLKPADNALTFPNFENQLLTLSQKHNLHLLRAAMLDFFFHYKWTLTYPNDFVPYDLQHSAHTLDDLLQPAIEAFDEDVDNHVEGVLKQVNLEKGDQPTGLKSTGMVKVAALSGSTATVSGQVSNFFEITETPALSDVAQTLLGGGGGGGSSKSSGSSDSSSGSGNSKNSPAASMAFTAGNFLRSNQAAAAIAAASIISPEKITAQLSRGMTLTISPISLDTASSAELNVNLSVNEPAGSGQSVNSSKAQTDLLDRVANHQVTDRVRVQSLKLFDLSTFSMELTHPQTPTCVPTTDNTIGRVLLFPVDAAFSVPCAAWKSVFGSTPIMSRLFEWPRNPVTIDNRSIAIVRAVVVPTAMDLGISVRFESDRVSDPVTGTTTPLFSIQQLGGKARPFHKCLMRRIVDETVNCATTLSTTPEDLRSPNTD